MKVSELKSIIEAARGERELDLILKGGLIINVITGEVEEGDLLVFDGKIVGIKKPDDPAKYKAKETVDVTGLYIAPGFIESHIHIESTMVTPTEFARGVLPRGTTTVIARVG